MYRKVFKVLRKVIWGDSAVVWRQWQHSCGADVSVVAVSTAGKAAHLCCYSTSSRGMWTMWLLYSPEQSFHIVLHIFSVWITLQHSSLSRSPCSNIPNWYVLPEIGIYIWLMKLWINGNKSGEVWTALQSKALVFTLHHWFVVCIALDCNNNTLLYFLVCHFKSRLDCH